MLKLWRRASLRTQLVVMIAVLLAISLIILATAASALLRVFLVDQMDSQLRVVNNGINISGFAFKPDQINKSTVYARLVGPDGKTVREQVVDGKSPDFPNYPAAEVRSKFPTTPFDIKNGNTGETWRAMIIPSAWYSVTDPNGQPQTYIGYVLVAMSYSDFDHSVSRLNSVMIAVSVLTVVLGTIAAFLIVTRAFRPLRRVERTAAAIADGDLSQRVRVENPATEVGTLSVALNKMLAHIESAFEARKTSEERMRRFIADASHELRTPLVTIRGFSELHRHGALPTEHDVSTAMGRIEGEAKRMGDLVEDLLVLARIDEQRPLNLSLVDLLMVGNDTAVDARARAATRSIKVIGLGSGPAVSALTEADESKLRQVAANLMSNALRYTPEGSPIEVAVGVTENGGKQFATLQIRDHGPGINDAEANRIFERFYRSESSRNRNTGGSGLGLAIVAAIIVNHRGTVRVSDTPGGGATMTIKLPLAEPPKGQADDEPMVETGMLEALPRPDREND